VQILKFLGHKLKLALQLLGNTQLYFDGDNSQGEFYSALTNNYQQADTGTKMTHIGKKFSRIISKGISAGKSKIVIED
jgi:Fe-S cluster assembly scaffold protein SufB